MGSCSPVTHNRPARGDPQAVAAWFSCIELGFHAFLAMFCSGVRSWRGAGGAWAHWSSSPCSLMGMAAVGSVSGRREGGSVWNPSWDLVTHSGHVKPPGKSWHDWSLSLCPKGGSSVISLLGSAWGKGSGSWKSLLFLHRIPQGYGQRLYLLPEFS